MGFLESLGCLFGSIIVLFFVGATGMRLPRKLAGAVTAAPFVALYFVLSSIWTGVTGFLVPAPTPSPTLIPRPTATIQSASHSTLCLRWDEITPDMAGKTLCVYGLVLDQKESFEIKQTFFYFGGPDQFFLTSTDRWGKAEGSCISETGPIQLNTYKVPYIKINGELDPCP